MGEVSDAVKKCCNILKNSGSDTEKFAALFMVTKLVKGKHATPNAKKAIFESIGFDFLRRLLLATDVPVDCPPSIYKSVALSIISVFCNEEELATKKEMLEFAPVFLDIVKTADDAANDDSLMAIGEAYNCLKGIAAYAPGQKKLIESQAVDKLGEIYSQGCFQSDEALNIMAVLIAKDPKSWNNKDPKAYHALLNKISVDFETDQDKRKFEICEVLHALVFNCPRTNILEYAQTEIWPHSVYKGLCDILQSKIGPAQRNPALLLTSSALELLGIEWIFTDEDKGKQIFLLLIQLAAIEIRMQLENKNLKSLAAHQNLITACYLILELCINYITEDKIDLEEKEKQTLYTGLKGAFTAIAGLMGKIDADKSKPSNSDKLFICATIRVLAAWLAQETTAMRPQIYQLLPFILELANETFYACRDRRLAEKLGTPHENNPLSNVDTLRVFLPALCHLVVEDDARRAFLKVKEEKVLLDVLEFHWTIVHYKRPPVPRSERLKALNTPITFTAEMLEDQKDSRAAMISTCNILMNLTVLEPKIVDQSEVFDNLSKFVFENLPELKDIPENLVLHGNLSVLGLLLLKQLSNKVKKNDFSLCRFIQATIRFLWDAYTIDQSSSDPSELVVAMAYKEHWMELTDLWYLGMQTISGVLKGTPWISEFAIESGWAEGICQLLKKVKHGALPPNVKSAFEDFLCHLVDANNSVVEVLKKADALQVCRNHRLMDLGKKLFGD
ncbi:unnamed protein product [Psylliodes chrysocephalus]|uniref:Neurochondrin-like protein n=1 Tax=Psylliodes chrysocephalus TaxID=3402493 RepID=A0A9P0GHT7_9CUCU|nr:unnamed protein product [Psylliodes chrysocephala]